MNLRVSRERRDAHGPFGPIVMWPVYAEPLGKQDQWRGRQHDETYFERRSKADCPVHKGTDDCYDPSRHEEIPLVDSATTKHDNAGHGQRERCVIHPEPPQCRWSGPRKESAKRIWFAPANNK